ncbi:MAG: Uma2 family endonuclease [Desulfuromonadales bacterium]
MGIPKLKVEYFTKLEERGVVGAPDLVVEILSPHTARKDLTRKFELYERAGVREYWVVYPDEKIIQVYRLEDGRYGRQHGCELLREGEESDMLRHVFRATEQRIYFDLPSDFLGHEVEMIAFCLDETAPVIKHKKKTLLDFASLLNDSSNFNGDPVEFQRELRNEWR